MPNAWCTLYFAATSEAEVSTSVSSLVGCAGLCPSASTSGEDLGVRTKQRNKNASDTAAVEMKKMAPGYVPTVFMYNRPNVAGPTMCELHGTMSSG
jgi:hypothetical protein